MPWLTGILTFPSFNVLTFTSVTNISWLLKVYIKSWLSKQMFSIKKSTFVNRLQNVLLSGSYESWHFRRNQPLVDLCHNGEPFIQAPQNIQRVGMNKEIYSAYPRCLYSGWPSFPYFMGSPDSYDDTEMVIY